MFPMEKALWILLQNNISHNETIIPLYRKYHQIDKTPCITITQADEYFLKRRYVEINEKQYLQKRYGSNIWINVWCNIEKERQSIVKNIENRILQAESNHYTTCQYYDKTNNLCSYLNRTCETLTVENGRSIKGQCPFPENNNYSSFFKTNNIIKNTFEIDSITNLDDLDKTGVVLRSIIKLNMEYYKYHQIGGRVFNDVKINEDLI